MPRAYSIRTEEALDWAEVEEFSNAVEPSSPVKKSTIPADYVESSEKGRHANEGEFSSPPSCAPQKASEATTETVISEAVAVGLISIQTRQTPDIAADAFGFEATPLDTLRPWFGAEENADLSCGQRGAGFDRQSGELQALAQLPQ